MNRKWMSIVSVMGMLLMSTAAVSGQSSASEAGEAQQLVETFLTAFQAKDGEAVAALLPEDVTLVQPFTFSGSATPEALFEGREQVMGYFDTVFTNFAQVRFTDQVISVANEGSTVFVEAQGDFITAQGDIPYHNVYVLKAELRDGQIVAITEYANPVTFAVTFGVELGTVSE